MGHSTHSEAEFLDLLRRAGVELIADVRRYPGSRRHPHFNAGGLAATLGGAGIDYAGFSEELGGRRSPAPDSANAAWRVSAFRAYADHMETPEFGHGLERLEAAATERRIAVMCAEGEWRRCHRRLISDALTARSWRVTHLRPDGTFEQHELPAFARSQNGQISYG